MAADAAFCPLCQEGLALLDHAIRCPRCFSKEYSQQRRLCARCIKHSPRLQGVAATFAHEGAAASLVTRLKYHSQPYLAEPMAAALYVQWEQLGWPKPDYLVAVPMARAKRLLRGYNQSVLLADCLGKLLGVPVAKPLKRRSGELAQAGMSRKQRLELDQASIVLRNGAQLEDRNILVIDDVMTTGTTLTRTAEALMGAYPASLRGLTFCAA